MVSVLRAASASARGALVPAVAEVGPPQDVELHRGFDEEDPREHVVYNLGARQQLGAVICANREHFLDAIELRNVSTLQTRSDKDSVLGVAYVLIAHPQSRADCFHT